jgi:hypothetical protein
MSAWTHFWWDYKRLRYAWGPLGSFRRACFCLIRDRLWQINRQRRAAANSASQPQESPSMPNQPTRPNQQPTPPTPTPAPQPQQEEPQR